MPNAHWNLLEDHKSTPFRAYILDNALNRILIMHVRLGNVIVNIIIPNILHKLSTFIILLFVIIKIKVFTCSITPN